LLERIERLFASVRNVARGARVELYHRASNRLRVRFDASEGREITETGTDEGLAARVVGPGDRVGFAAVSGCDVERVRWAVLQAGRSSGEGRVDVQPWADHTGEPLTDLESSTTPPDASELTTRLRRFLNPSTERWSSSPPAWSGSWIEWGKTLETWVADGGMRATRSRSRVWAMTTTRLAPAHGGGEHPLVAVGRHLDDMTGFGWNVPAVEGLAVPIDDAVTDRAVLLEPTAAAVLVRALTSELCGPGPPTRHPVGPGLRVDDDPAHPRGLSGGRFDDAGFPALRMPLADGHRFLGSPRGPGHLRRGSFRDRPAPGLTTLVVGTGEATVPAEAVRVPDLRIHVVTPGSWAVEPIAAWIADGGQARPVARGVVGASAADLARRCQGAFDMARLSSNNTLTPALLLDGLPS
jgi:hypothetical protein